jgi:hypothetical protein
MEKLDDFYSRFTETMRELTLKMLAESSATARQHVKEILSQSPPPKDISKIINEHVKSKEILNERVSHKGVKKQ